MDELLPDPDIDDLAMDFVEERLGRFNFMANWARLRRLQATVSAVKKWLLDKKLDLTKADAVAHQVDSMYRRKAKWSS